jgi:hypothetical protein
VLVEVEKNAHFERMLYVTSGSWTERRFADLPRLISRQIVGSRWSVT